MSRRHPGASCRVSRRFANPPSLAWLAILATALLPGLAVAQAPKAAAPKAAAPKAAAPPPAQVSDLTTRYRLIEQYVGETDKVKAKPGEISQYRVASRDLIKVSEEKAQGAPQVQERTVQVIYAERPAAVTSSGAVTDVVRRYEALRTLPAPPNGGQAPKLLEGLNLWIKPRLNSPPMMILIGENRRLSETEFSVNARQIFMPDLASVLPSMPRRIGDKWQLPRPAIQAMLGEAPLKNSPLVATLADIRKGTKGGEMVAVIAIAGRVALSPGIENAVKAQILFTFVPPAPEVLPGSSSANEKEGVIDVRGAITELKLVKSSTIPIPGGSGRLRRSLTEELVLQRQMMPASSSAPLNVPSPPPVPTEANSWLTYDDPQGRFHFRHPQDLLQQPDAPPTANEVILHEGESGSGVGSTIFFVLQTRTGDAQADSAARDPDNHVKDLNEEWAETKKDVLRGPSGWLPEADWNPSKMKVYRIEAALKPSGAAGRNVQRIFLDYYLLLFSEKESVVVNAMTGQDPPLPFRKQAETILKTFKLGPSSADGKGT